MLPPLLRATPRATDSFDLRGERLVELSVCREEKVHP